MPRDIEPCVYIVTNWKNTVLYTGVTNNLFRRMQEHREKKGGKFTRRYNLSKLVYVATTERIEDAIAYEKQIKAGSRQDKIALVNSMNPDWNDLYDELFE
jgi:putative endonuclease